SKTFCRSAQRPGHRQRVRAFSVFAGSGRAPGRVRRRDGVAVAHGRDEAEGNGGPSRRDEAAVEARSFMVRNVDETPAEESHASGPEKGAPHKDDENRKGQPKGPPWYKRRWVLPAAIVLGILLLAGVTVWIWYARKYESTDDAY